MTPNQKLGMIVVVLLSAFGVTLSVVVKTDTSGRPSLPWLPQQGVSDPMAGWPPQCRDWIGYYERQVQRAKRYGSQWEENVAIGMAKRRIDMAREWQSQGYQFMRDKCSLGLENLSVGLHVP